MMTEEMAKAVQVLLDKQAIHDALMRYCRGVDRCDEELMRSVYHEDAKAFGTLAWEFVKEFVPSNRAATSFTVHAIQNLTIEVHDDEAFSEAYFITYVGRPEGEAEYVDLFCGRYIDRWERRGGEWRVIHRDVAREWARGDAFGTGQFPVPPSEDGTFIQPMRSRHDLSYQGLTGK
jgi:hypothetical protein